MIGFVIILALMIPLLAVILDSQLGRALAARLERDAGKVDAGVAQRLAGMEAELERLTQEVRRLDEEAQFTQKLLESRDSNEALPPGESTR